MWLKGNYEEIICNPSRIKYYRDLTSQLNNLVEIQGKIKKEEKLALADFQTVQSVSDWPNFEPEVE